jgi:hypothetical protein
MSAMLDRIITPDLADRIGLGLRSGREWADGQVERLLAGLEEIRQAVDAMDDRAETTRYAKAAQADAAGAAVVTIPARLGYQRTVERITVVAPGTAATVAEVFVGSRSDLDLVDRIEGVATGIRVAREADYLVVEGADLIIVLAGVTANQAVSVGVQYVQVPTE